MEKNEFKSSEEWYFSMYLDGLKTNNIIESYQYEPNTFTLSKPKYYPIFRQLKTKGRLDKLSLLQEHIYTPDFRVRWNEQYNHIIYRLIDDLQCRSKPPFFAIKSNQDFKPYSFFEIKGNFDYNNMTRLFRITQKWLYDKYDIYVDLISVPGIFKSTFVPERYMRTDSDRQTRKINFDIKTFNQYFKSIHYA